MSKIQWTDRTCNPLKEAEGGNYCIPISTGCKNCYASILNSKGTRFGGNGRPFGIRPEGHPEMTLNIEMLAKWARMRKPKKHFVGSMTDIFGEWVSDKMIFRLFDAMEAAPLQTFQILTKRPERASDVIGGWLYSRGHRQMPSNIWIGTSAESQATFKERLKWLFRCPAQVKFLSLEPILEPIQFPLYDLDKYDLPDPMRRIDWIIVGGESGPNARPMKLEWIEVILRQCRQASVPAFVKQLGSHWVREVGASHNKGGDPGEWPSELRVRMFPGDVW